MLTQTVRKLTTREIHLENKKRTKESNFFNTIVILDNIRSMHNVGSFFRTSDAFGLSKLYLTGITPCPPRPEISKSALGAEEFVDWEYWKNAIDLITELKHQGYYIIGIEQTTESVLLHQFKLESSNKYALIFGNEVKGISDEVIKKCDLHIEIPQFGDKHSFNVSVSYGIVLYSFFEKFIL